MTSTLELPAGTATLDLIARKHTSFDSFAALVDAAGGYRPSIYIRGKPLGAQMELVALADAYDLFQAARNDTREAYRGDFRKGDTVGVMAHLDPATATPSPGCRAYKALRRIRLTQDWGEYHKGAIFILIAERACAPCIVLEDGAPLLRTQTNLRVVKEGEVIEDPTGLHAGRAIPGELTENVTDPMTAVRQAQGKAEREARQEGHKFIRSRGRIIGTSGKNGVCDPYQTGNAIQWDGTLANLKRVVAEVSAAYPEVQTVFLQGGYDGSDTIGFDDYCPWASSWEVEVWTRSAGWLVTI